MKTITESYNQFETDLYVLKTNANLLMYKKMLFGTKKNNENYNFARGNLKAIKRVTLIYN